jgi:DNA-binding NarL/FixJ family response regulator
LEDSDIEVVDTAETGRQAVELACRHQPDVVILEVALPELNGINATTEILQQCGCQVLVLTSNKAPATVRGMLQAGASGYVLKQCDFADVVSALRAIQAGKTYLSPEIAAAVVDDYVGDTGRGFAPRISNREREVLQLIAEGLSTKQIAGQLYVSVKTIETHRRNIMNKLEIHSIAGLTKYAIRQGLTTVDA